MNQFTTVNLHRRGVLHALVIMTMLAGGVVTFK